MSRLVVIGPLRLLYAFYAVAAFLAVGLVTLVLLLVLPRIGQRRAAARWSARAFLALAGMLTLAAMAPAPVLFLG